MGLHIGFSNWENTTSASANPNPYSYNIVRQVEINGIFIAEINYPGCTNFEGNKILVGTSNFYELTSIDPHFMKNGWLLARFVPTELGWEMAENFVKGLS